MAQNLDPTGANTMQTIKDRITKTLTDATKDMSPTETFAQTGRAAAQAATSQVTFGDALNAQKAKRMEAMDQLKSFFNQERQALQADQQINLQRQAGERAERQLGFEEQRLDLDRDELTYQKLQDAADRSDEDAIAVVDALKALVPEEQRATYAAALNDLPYDVSRANVVTAVGRIRQHLEASGGVPQEQADYDDEAGLRKELTNISKDFVQVKDAYSRILTSAHKPSPAGDLSMIFNYMKMLDPGSTVREGEFSNAAKAAPLLEQLGISFNKVSAVWEGKMLTEDQRRDFVGRAQDLFKGALKGQDALAEGFKGIAERRGFNPKNVVIDFAGPMRLPAMSDEELTSALEAASSHQEVDSIMAEVDRRKGVQ